MSGGHYTGQVTIWESSPESDEWVRVDKEVWPATIAIMPADGGRVEGRILDPVTTHVGRLPQEAPVEAGQRLRQIDLSTGEVLAEYVVRARRVGNSRSRRPDLILQLAVDRVG